MFEYIFGELTIKKIDYVAIDINGLAYKIFISLKTFETLKEIGENKNAVNQQEWIAVRQLFKDVVDVHDVVESFW